MGKVIDSLYMPMALKNAGDNIDPRYFKDNEDGTYTLTPLMIYSIARDAAAYFKQRIFDIDDANQYHTSSVRQVKDTWSQKAHDDQWKLKYGDKIKEATIRWYKYRDEHPDEFETRFKRVATGGEDENRFFNGYSPDIKPGLVGTVQAYNAAKELQSRFAKPDKDGNGGSEYENLPFEEPLYSKADFAEQHKAVRAKISEEIGIPNDDFEVGKIEKVVCRISNKKCDAAGSDDSEIEGFVEGLIKHITSSNAMEFKAKREECLTLIDKDFIANFNDNAKELKAIDGSNNSIEIYTKTTTDEAPLKLITIMKEEPSDPNYKYYLSIVTGEENLRYNKIIATKADLRKALENTKMMIEDIDSFKKYVPDIDRTIDNL